MSALRSTWRWLCDNEGKLAGFLAVATEIGAAFWNMHLHQAVDLGSLGAGLAAVLAAAAAPPAARAMLARQQLALRRAEYHDAK